MADDQQSPQLRDTKESQESHESDSKTEKLTEERIDSGFQSFTSLASSCRPSLEPSSSLLQIEETESENYDQSQNTGDIRRPFEHSDDKHNPILQNDQKNDKRLDERHDSGFQSFQSFTDLRIDDNLLELLLAIFSQDEDGDTMLHTAVLIEDDTFADKIVDIACEWDASNQLQLLDIENDLKQTPLHLATLTRNHSAMSSLVCAGANPFLQDRDLNTPLHIACRGLDDKAVDILLEQMKSSQKKELLETSNSEGQRCLHVCNTNKHINIIAKLCKSGIDINAREGKSGLTLLHIAANNGDAELVRYLLQLPAIDLEECSYNGVTPLMLAESRDEVDIVKMLENNGCQYNEIDSEPEDTDTES